MMQDQPALSADTDILFLLTGSWGHEGDEAGGPFLCADCCTMEGALAINTHWADAITLARVEYARPRAEIIALLDEAHQNAPTLILADTTEAHVDVVTCDNGRRIITDPSDICRQLAACYGGAKPS